MSVATFVIKSRALLGRLRAYGLEASRATATGETQTGMDALLVAQDRRAWLIGIWQGDSLEPRLFGGDNELTLREFAVRLSEKRVRLQADAGEALPQLLIMAPALPASEITDGYCSVGAERVRVLADRVCRKPAVLAAEILMEQQPILSEQAIAHWRAAIAPEVKIEGGWKRKKVTRVDSALAAPLLLDYKQERCARLDLETEAEAEVEHLAKALQLRAITGVAGCGKTLVLVHRAALLATHFPRARVLLVSFNRPLIHDLKRRLANYGASERIECMTFFQWLNRVASAPHEMMHQAEAHRWIERERGALVSLSKLSTEWLREEMQWMCDHALADKNYLTAERKGRGTRLSPKQRREMLTLMVRFRDYLRLAKRSDWSEWPLTLSESPPASLQREQFDHLLIDEAQFFAPVWLQLLRGALKPGGHLFLCADPTQGFLKRRMSWASLGLDVRSRSHRLERPYRSTRAILEFAKSFYQSRMVANEEPLNLPSPEWLEVLEEGLQPIVQPAGAGQDQMNRMVDELRHLRAHGTLPGHVLILLAGRSMSVDALVLHLNHQLGQGAAFSMKDENMALNSTGVAHLMAATGLERPVVFLLGVDDLMAEEDNPTLTDEERAEKREMHTRQVYVGLTRAMESLVIYSDRLFKPGNGA
jgi:hypothetical protein